MPLKNDSSNGDYWNYRKILDPLKLNFKINSISAKDSQLHFNIFVKLFLYEVVFSSSLKEVNFIYK